MGSLRIPNLENGDQAPCISVFGRSLMTHCHFDLEDSDDIRWICDKPELRGYQDPNIRVIKFNAVGFSSTSTRCVWGGVDGWMDELFLSLCITL